MTYVYGNVVGSEKSARSGFHDLPKTLILPTRQMVIDFREAVGVEVFNIDGHELMAQVCMWLNDKQSRMKLNACSLPELDRLRSCNHVKDSRQIDTLRQATVRFTAELQTLIEQLGCYFGEEFPYFFERTIADDMVFSYMGF